jgi:hypothetical protein
MSPKRDRLRLVASDEKRKLTVAERLAHLRPGGAPITPLSPRTRVETKQVYTDELRARLSDAAQRVIALGMATATGLVEPKLHPMKGDRRWW